MLGYPSLLLPPGEPNPFILFDETREDLVGERFLQGELRADTSCLGGGVPARSLASDSLDESNGIFDFSRSLPESDESDSRGLDRIKLGPMRTAGDCPAW